MSSPLLEDKVALITGAAGAIGRAIAWGFAREGARLCLVDVDPERLQAVTTDIEQEYGKPTVRQAIADVKQPSQVRACVAQFEMELGSIDILVNNAAVTQIKRIDELDDCDIDEVIDTNLKGYIYFAREFVRSVTRNKRQGAILIISSKNGLEGASEKSLYSATKGGVITLARALARELGPEGIRVNTICPDAVHEGSKLWERGGPYSLATARRYHITEDEIPEHYRQRCALGVNIKPEDVANAAVFLVSDNASKITGAVLTVDGGVAFVR